MAWFRQRTGVERAETEILLVPTIGHTRGHCAVAVRSGEQWLLHCGDAYFHHGELQRSPQCPPALVVMQHAIAENVRQMRKNKRRLRELKLHAGGDLNLFCAHDPLELEQYQVRQTAAVGNDYEKTC